jgi:hypothetical protein
MMLPLLQSQYWTPPIVALGANEEEKMTDGLEFRVTFNKPAVLRYFESASGLQFKIENEEVIIRPMTLTRGADTVALEERNRGGFEAIVGGTLASSILPILQKEATINQPFFILTPAGKGWLGLKHFTDADFPPKYDPYLRFWAPIEKETGIQSAISLDEDENLPDHLVDFVMEVKKAHALIEKYKYERKVGRPSREIKEAKSVLALLERLAKGYLPRRGGDIDIDISAVEQARSLLAGFISVVNAEREFAEEES